ncbi:MAG: hypothetical protein Rubg2KO_12100 [Rubricoccaceae bacterium]
MDVSGAVLTASDPSQGWGGVRFEAGSDGHWSGNTTIEKVKGYGSANLRITNASPTFSNVTIQDAVAPSAVYGIEISGSNAYPTEDDWPGGGGQDGPFNNVRVRRMTADGIRVHSSANFRATDLLVELNDHDGIDVGYSGEAFLHPDTFSPSDFGAQIASNDYDGLRASYGSSTTLGYYYYGQYGVYPYGLNTFTGNGSNGIEASGGVVGGGSSDNKTKARNRLFGNLSGIEARSSGGSAYLRCNWWGEDALQNALPPQTSTSGGGVLYADVWLDEDPYDTTTPPCADFGAGGARHAGSGARVLSPEAEWLLAGVESAGDPKTALSHFDRVLAEAPDSPEAAAALVQIGWMAQRPNAIPEMLATLESISQSSRASHRLAAFQGLIRLRYEDGDMGGALALADQLLASAEKSRTVEQYAQIERAYLLSGLGRKAEATHALARASALQLDPETVDAARDALGIREDVLRAAASAVKDDASLGQQLLPPTPNPAHGQVRVPLTLEGTAYVRADVLDALGRVVTTLFDGALEAEEHLFTLDTEGLAPGVYIIRADLRPDEGAPVILQQRLTVVR